MVRLSLTVRIFEKGLRVRLLDIEPRRWTSLDLVGPRWTVERAVCSCFVLHVSTVIKKSDRAQSRACEPLGTL